MLKNWHSVLEWIFLGENRVIDEALKIEEGIEGGNRSALAKRGTNNGGGKPGSDTQPLFDGIGHRILLFDLGGVIATFGMAGMALAVTVRHTAQLYRQEPLR